MVELELAHLFRLIKETLQTESTPGGFFPAIPALLMNLHRQHPELRQIMMREIVDGSPRLPAMMKEMGENGPLGLKKLLVSQMETAGECAFPADIPPNHYLALIFAMGHGLMAFAPLLAVGFGLDLENEETAEAVGNSAGKMVRSTLSPVKEA